MKPNTLILVLLACGLLAPATSCDRGQGPSPESGRGAPTAGVATRPGVVELETMKDIQAAAGQTIYVPAYSHIAIGDQAHPFNLAVTLSVRNTDRASPIIVSAVHYHDSGGRLVRDFLKKPVRVAPLASVEFFIKESDTSGGSSASFLVDWVAERAVSDPAVEAVMIGAASTQGISFVCTGRVVADLTRRERGPVGAETQTPP